MTDSDRTKSNPESLGAYLRALRTGTGMSLREVEEATDKAVSNAYLSQLENGKIQQPSPNVLHALASVYGVQYIKLMERAGYVAPEGQRSKSQKHGRAATYSVDNLSADEEKQLLEYLAFIRTQRGRS